MSFTINAVAAAPGVGALAAAAAPNGISERRAARIAHRGSGAWRGREPGSAIAFMGDGYRLAPSNIE